MELNFFSIQFGFDESQIIKEPKTRLTERKKELNTTHSFFRNGGDAAPSNKDGSEEYLTSNFNKVNLLVQYRISFTLTHHFCFRTFNNSFTTDVSQGFYPFLFFSKQEKEERIEKRLPDPLKRRVFDPKRIKIPLKPLTIDDTITH